MGFMKKLSYMIVLAAISFSTNGPAQLVPNGSFENGTLPSTPWTPGETLDPSIALPNWSISGSPLYYQAGPLGGPVIAITSESATSNGTNSVYLQAGFGGALDAVSVWQNLLIPAYAKTITFESKAVWDPGLYPAGYYLALLVSAAGTVTSPSYISTDVSGLNTYAIDVSAFAGSTMELKFSVDPMGSNRGGAWQIDNIQYSTTPVPEPGIVTFLSYGTLTLLFLRARRSH